MNVSSIANGAGSVAVLALHALPTTVSTSGNSPIILFVCKSSSNAFSSETSGIVIGIYMIDHSSSGGINSVPICVDIPTQTTTNHATIANVTFLQCNARKRIFLYQLCNHAL